MKIGENIRKIRKEKGLTQKKLGELCEMNEVQIRQYELGKANPKIETAMRIANALNVDIGDLADTDELAMIDIKENPEKWGLSSSIQNRSNDIDIMKHYNKLNTLGKGEAEKRVEELTEIPRYTKPD